jgi:hypothetical protein
VTEQPNFDIESEIERLEAGIRQLKIQYDMFFAGAIPKQPIELRAEIERLIKRYSNAPIRQYAHRFHFNSLASRFNSYTELWAKTLKNLEEGDRPAPAVPEKSGQPEKVLARCKFRDPEMDAELLRVLHERYVEARRKSGSGPQAVSFQNFVRGIASQAERLRSSSGCEEIELRLIVHDRKVTLKARPSR